MKYKKSKKVVLLLLFLLILLSSSLALDCQYTDNETYTVPEERYYLMGKYIGTGLDMNNAFPVSIDGYKIKISNTLPVNVELNLSYTRYSSNFGVNQKISQKVIVGSKNSFTYTDDWLQSLVGNPYGSGSLNDVTASLSPWLFVSSSIEQVPYIREVCKKCEGKNCLDDGSNCERSSQCGSLVCNIRKECGPKNSAFVVPCPENQKNCNDTKCATPSSLGVGQKYECTWECKTQFGVDNVCQKTPEELQRERANQIFIFVAIIILISGISTTFILRSSTEKIKADIENKKAKITLEMLDREELKEEYIRGKKRLQKLREQITTTKGKAKNTLEEAKKITELNQKNILNKFIESEEITRKIEASKKELESINKEKEKIMTEKEAAIQETKNQKEEYERFKQLSESISTHIRDLKFLKEQIGTDESLKKKFKEIREEKEKEIKSYLESCHKKYGGPGFILENGRLKYKHALKNPHKTGDWYHIAKYKKESNDLDYNPLIHQIHHIDNNPLNNEMWNLIRIDKQIHAFIHENNKTYSDYKTGIELLEKYGVQLPERVKNHIKSMI